MSNDKIRFVSTRYVDMMSIEDYSMNSSTAVVREMEICNGERVSSNIFNLLRHLKVSYNVSDPKTILLGYEEFVNLYYYILKSQQLDYSCLDVPESFKFLGIDVKMKMTTGIDLEFGKSDTEKLWCNNILFNDKTK